MAWATPSTVNVTVLHRLWMLGLVREHCPFESVVHVSVAEIGPLQVELTVALATGL